MIKLSSKTSFKDPSEKKMLEKMFWRKDPSEKDPSELTSFGAKMPQKKKFKNIYFGAKKVSEQKILRRNITKLLLYFMNVITCVSINNLVKLS